MIGDGFSRPRTCEMVSWEGQGIESIIFCEEEKAMFEVITFFNDMGRTWHVEVQKAEGSGNGEPSHSVHPTLAAAQEAARDLFAQFGKEGDVLFLG
jgi:hypothetical protein